MKCQGEEFGLNDGRCDGLDGVGPGGEEYIDGKPVCVLCYSVYAEIEEIDYDEEKGYE